MFDIENYEDRLRVEFGGDGGCSKDRLVFYSRILSVFSSNPFALLESPFPHVPVQAFLALDTLQIGH